MPELPEVETTARGIAPHIVGRRIRQLLLRRQDLRWPIPPELTEQLAGQELLAVERRAKFLRLHVSSGAALVHLGMSGSLRLVDEAEPARLHDHWDLLLVPDGERPARLRYHDPRRFGALLWEPAGSCHALLAHLGPEPFDACFDGAWLRRAAQGRRLAIQALLMDGRVVVGVGNIYAAEALFRAGIRPDRSAGRISASRLQRLSDVVRELLSEAIAMGGTTLRDFVQPGGAPGYFVQTLAVYGRAQGACIRPGCEGVVQRKVIGQRSSYFCPRCQH